MIASSLKEGDDLVDLLLSKGADVNAKSKEWVSGCHRSLAKPLQISAVKYRLSTSKDTWITVIDSVFLFRQHCISAPPRITLIRLGSLSDPKPLQESKISVGSYLCIEQPQSALCPWRSCL